MDKKGEKYFFNPDEERESPVTGCMNAILIACLVTALLLGVWGIIW